MAGAASWGMPGAPKSFRVMAGCWGAPGQGQEQQGQSQPALALGVAQLGAATGAEATVPRCGWEISTSSRVCQSTEHSHEHGGAPGYAKAWGCWEVPQDLILFASPSLSPCQSNRASPGAQAGAAQGRDGPCRGKGLQPHIPPDQHPRPIHHPA